MNPWAVMSVFGVASFAIGSIPFGLLIARSKGVDIREHGSGNIGATNVYRVIGARAGVVCFVLDVCKGLVPALGASLVAGSGVVSSSSAQVLALVPIVSAASSICGHIFSPFVGFKGGKGVATGLGAMTGVFPALTFPALLAAAVWGATLKGTRFVSVASCAAAVSMPTSVAAWMLIGPFGGLGPPTWSHLVATVLLGALVVYRHRGNLSRVAAGTEPRVGERVDQSSGGAL